MAFCCPNTACKVSVQYHVQLNLSARYGETGFFKFSVLITDDVT